MPRVQSDALTDRAARHSAEPATFQEGQKLGGFTACALLTDAIDQPMGARFVHESGMTVDVFHFALVPRASITARTLPVSDQGEFHRPPLPARLLARSGSLLDG